MKENKQGTNISFFFAVAVGLLRILILACFILVKCRFKPLSWTFKHIGQAPVALLGL